MVEAQTVLLADSSEERRRQFGLALYGGGYELVNAVNADEAVRFATGLDPSLVMAHTGLDGAEPTALRATVAEHMDRLPPFLVLHDGDFEPEDELPDGVYALCSSTVEPERLLQQVRLLLLSREVGGDLSDTIDLLYGDLARISVGELLRVLLRNLITCRVVFAAGSIIELWVHEGVVVHARWAEVLGVKAFNRVAALRAGSFTLTLETFEGERTITTDLASLVSDALDEKFQLDELLAELPSLDVTLELKMVDQFFQIEFSQREREVLNQVQARATLAQLLDRIGASDLEVTKAVMDLHERGVVAFTEPEHRVVVVTDSTCDLRPAMARRNGIRIVPLSVLFDREVFRDGIDLQPDEFYAKLAASTRLPSTSPPSKGEFLERYRREVGRADVLSLHISAKQSKTLESAMQAASEGQEEFDRLRGQESIPGPVHIRVVDSWFNSIGLGMMAIFAARMLRRGLDLEDVATRLEDIRTRCQMLFVVNTLEYLQKGGRIGKAQAMLGTLLGIKPILGMVNGEVVPVDKVRGGRKVQARLVEILAERLDPERPVIVGMAHATAPKWAGRLHQHIEERFSVAEVFQTAIGPVVGTHVGPGCVGTSVFQPTAEELQLVGPGTDEDLNDEITIGN